MPSNFRHNDDWFLSRSSHRSTLAVALRRLAVLALVALIMVVIVTYYFDRHPKSPPSGASVSTTLRTTTTSSSTTTTSFPSALHATSVSGDDAYFDVPATRYQVVVRGRAGPTWAVYEMGAANTLEWQGTVATSHVEALTMNGNSRITVGSPSNASVDVNGSPVVFPTPLPPTLILVLRSSASG